jgi:hypothetical protein
MRFPVLVHITAAVWITAIATLSIAAPASYDQLLQEDRAVEWTTVWLFLIAAIGFGINARRGRRADAIVAAFCVVVAGEECSWGQRLIGYTAPEFFLAHNYQQEMNVHNLPQAIVQPKWMLMAVLAVYGLLLPLAANRPRVRAQLDRAALTTPPRELAPWFAAAIGLLLWYPLTFTGEWVEALAGGLFLVASGTFRRTWWAFIAAASVLGVIATHASARVIAMSDIERVTCAQREVDAIAADIVSGQAATDRLWRMRSVHKRVWSAIGEEYLRSERLSQFTHACADDSSAHNDLRRKYAIDPWGGPYWVLVEGLEGRTRIVVYSFGPNRRREIDSEALNADRGDDVIAERAR